MEIELRKYQKKAIENAIKSISVSSRPVLIEMSTGTGKTHTMINLVRALKENDGYGEKY